MPKLQFTGGARVIENHSGTIELATATSDFMLVNDTDAPVRVTLEHVPTNLSGDTAPYVVQISGNDFTFDATRTGVTTVGSAENFIASIGGTSGTPLTAVATNTAYPITYDVEIHHRRPAGAADYIGTVPSNSYVARGVGSHAAHVVQFYNSSTLNASNEISAATIFGSDPNNINTMNWLLDIEDQPTTTFEVDKHSFYKSGVQSERRPDATTHRDLGAGFARISRIEAYHTGAACDGEYVYLFAL